MLVQCFVFNVFPHFRVSLKSNYIQTKKKQLGILMCTLFFYYSLTFLDLTQNSTTNNYEPFIKIFPLFKTQKSTQEHINAALTNFELYLVGIKTTVV